MGFFLFLVDDPEKVSHYAYLGVTTANRLDDEEIPPQSEYKWIPVGLN